MRILNPEILSPEFFFHDLLFFFGILAPDFRASLRAIATACLRLFTFLRPPDFSVPSLYSCITFLVFARPFVADDRFLDAVFFAIKSSLARYTPTGKCFRGRRALCLLLKPSSAI